VLTFVIEAKIVEPSLNLNCFAAVVPVMLPYAINLICCGFLMEDITGANVPCSNIFSKIAVLTTVPVNVI